ncbi:Uma2 family endonuclease [Bacillus rubiinfantis]|uniref:Uma2 family endonuclease n=1 Tax=Bacillus rubiinfantis TaxID=1499680 RepID=UPI0005A6D520|nr:Uma2 family endonuclease [Bacillus rubiinfantis]
MGMPKQKKYTYEDYLTWDESLRCEAIEGEIISMSPSPTPKHQDVVAELTAEFTIFLRGKECMAFSAPIDVCLFASRETSNQDIQDWVQPDLIVVCDQKKITEKNIVGAPELVVEVLSPSTARNDRWIKYNSYEKAGVKEYWIVDPLNLSVEVYELNEASFKQTGVYGKEDTLTVGILPELQIQLNTIFKD